MALVAFAALGCTLTACTDNEIYSDGPTPEQAATAADNAISFGTYMGRNQQTRAGYVGNINTNTLKDIDGTGTWRSGSGSGNEKLSNGFGVFAYYTGTKTYGDYVRHKTSGEANIAANFMFNQQVYWDKDSKYEGYVNGEGTGTSSAAWVYSPVKYWPNEVTEHNTEGDDDQENEQDDAPSYTSGGYGGNVSFFAYAPYVTLPETDWAETSGIIEINTKKNLSDANAEKTDPIITYKLATDGKNVDLLWGTMGSTSQNVNNGGNFGVQGDGDDSNDVSGDTYAKKILGTYKVNADLTKQKTNGTVNFAFKHALAKVGGSNNTDVPAGTSTTNGLMVVLDIDDFKGAEMGGEREKFPSSGSGTDDAWRTIVTIKTIEISNDLSADGSLEASVTIGSNTYNEKLIRPQGTFNLATGQWTIDETVEPIKIGQTVGTKEKSSGTNDVVSLNKKIAEYKTYDSDETNVPYVKDYSDKVDYFKFLDNSSDNLTKDNEGSHPGVTEKAQNVYEETDVAPLVFIPGTKPVLRFTIDYVVRTYDKNLSTEYTEVGQKISKIVTFPQAVELNKQYNILMHLGLTGVKFTATVSNWDMDGGSNPTDIDGNGTIDLLVDDVYLPINVSGLMLKFSAGPKNVGSATNTETTLATVGNAYYYDKNTKVDATPASLTWETDPSSCDWISASDADVKLVASKPNTTWNDNVVKVTAKMDEQHKSEPITIIQYGRIATAATLTYTSTAPDILTSEQENTAGTEVDLSTNGTLKVSGYESDEAGNVTSTAVPEDEYSEYEIVFIDDVTGAKADWITIDSTKKKVTLSANESSNPKRSATMYVKVGKRIVKVVNGSGNNYQIMQKAGA